MAIVALICGIIGVAGFLGIWVPGSVYVSLVASIVAIACGASARKKLALAGQPTGMATAGMVLGIIGVVLSGAILACAVCAVGFLAAASV